MKKHFSELVKEWRNKRVVIDLKARQEARQTRRKEVPVSSSLCLSFFVSLSLCLCLPPSLFLVLPLSDSLSTSKTSSISQETQTPQPPRSFIFFSVKRIVTLIMFMKGDPVTLVSLLLLLLFLHPLSSFFSPHPLIFSPTPYSSPYTLAFRLSSSPSLICLFSLLRSRHIHTKEYRSHSTSPLRPPPRL